MTIVTTCTLTISFFRTGVLKCVAEAGEHSSRRSIGTCHLAGQLNLELDLVVDLLHFLHFLQGKVFQNSALSHAFYLLDVSPQVDHSSIFQNRHALYLWCG